MGLALEKASAIGYHGDQGLHGCLCMLSVVAREGGREAAGEGLPLQSEGGRFSQSPLWSP